ncbi:MAG TPA: phage tail tape measure protein [Thermomicrobiales bacterium]|nr:phage tail tape measure protein [Thermomicrobiales bacterium]
MTAQEAGAYRAWLEQQRAVEDTAGKLGALETASGKAARKGADLERQLQQIAVHAGRVGEQSAGAGQKMGGLGSATQSVGRQMSSFLNSSIARWATLGGGIGVAASGIRKIVAAMKEVRSEEAETTLSLDEHFRRFATQAQLSEKDLPEIRRVAFGVARETALPVETVLAAGKQLVSSGFSPEEVLRGGALREMAHAIQATTAMGKDFNPTEAAESMTQLILAQVKPEDRQLNVANLRKVMRTTQGMYLRRNIQFADLTYLARAAPALSGAGIDPETQLAAFTTLRNTFQPEQSGTMLRNLVVRLTTAKDHDKKVEALGELGLLPEDVDLVGESLETALARMKRGAKGKTDAEINSIFATLFEAEGMTGARALIENVENISKYRAEGADWSRYGAAYKMMTSGEHAADVRLQIDKQQERYGGAGAEDELIAEALEARIPGWQGKVTRSYFESLAPVVGTKGALAAAVPGPEAAYYYRLVEEAQVGGDTGGPRSGRPAPLWNQAQFEANERQLEAKRATLLAEEKKEQAAAQLEAQVSANAAAGEEAYRLVIAAPRNMRQLRSTVWDPDEVDAEEDQYTAEAEAVRETFKRGRVQRFSRGDAEELHRRVSEQARDDPTVLRLDKLVELIGQLVADREAVQQVEIKNPGEPKRRERRRRPPGSRPRGLAGS